MERGKIGIFLPGGNGDIMSAMSVLKYKDALWPDKDIVWFCGLDGHQSGSMYRDVLKYNDAISEIRIWEDFITYGLKDANNRLDQSHKHLFESTKDLEQGYFPAPWMMTVEQRHGIDYPNISRKVFSADPSWEWHPYLGFSDEERKAVEEFFLKLPRKKTIMLETSASSFVSLLDDDLVRETISMCRAKLGECNFIFVSLGGSSKFSDEVEAIPCSCFTVRQTALVSNYCDLFIGISSGISVATCCWGNKPVPKLQYCQNFFESTVSLANGPIELVVREYPDARQNHNHRQEFKSKLSDILGKL
jgi:hypothetical protein